MSEEKDKQPEEKGKPEESYKTLGEEIFAETKDGGQSVVISEAPDGAKVIGLKKFYKTTKDGKEEVAPRKGKFFTFRMDKLQSFINSLFHLVKKFGWKIDETESEKKIVELNDKIGQLNLSLSNLNLQKTELEQTKIDLEKQVDEVKKQLIKTNYDKFKKDIDEFNEKLSQVSKKGIPEEELQQFLKDRPWIFGLEYIQSEPKKPAGSKSKFDFYLTDYRNHGVIIELKLPSEKILGSEMYALSSKSSESIGQLMRYMETTQAISASVEMSKIENIKEKKPIGYLIIGINESQEEKDQLHIINSYYHRIEIMTYDDLLLKSKTTLETFRT